MRSVPTNVQDAWKRLETQAPVDAVRASRELHQSLAFWQADLVLEALADGVSWEAIGDALGTTRQAAWARFRTVVEQEGGRSVMDQRKMRREHIVQHWDAGQARLRELDLTWRKEQDQLREEARQSRERLREAARDHARKRQTARQQLRREIAALKAEAASP